MSLARSMEHEKFDSLLNSHERKKSRRRLAVAQHRSRFASSLFLTSDDDDELPERDEQQ
jgi:hypothetical protein